MIGTIISAIVVGLIVGALARLVLPGKQNIGMIMTIILGALGAFVGSWVTTQITGKTGFDLVSFIVGVVVAVLLIALYLAATGRRSVKS